MSEPRIEKLYQELSELNDEQRVEVFRRLFETWKDSESDDETGWKTETKYFLGSACRSVDENGEWEAWDVYGIAYPDIEEYGGLGPDWGFCQEAKCTSCGILLASNCKKAHCPICGALAGLT